MAPDDLTFDPMQASDAELTLYLARQGVQPSDVKRTLEVALERVRLAKANDERPWEEFELERVAVAA